MAEGQKHLMEKERTAPDSDVSNYERLKSWAFDFAQGEMEGQWSFLNANIQVLEDDEDLSVEAEAVRRQWVVTASTFGSGRRVDTHDDEALARVWLRDGPAAFIEAVRERMQM